MLEIHATTEIAATAETVWKILTDLERYHEWNPFIRDARGSLEIGGRVRVRVRPRFQFPLVFEATILHRDERRELHWRGNVGGDWLASGDHRFVIEPVGDHRVRFTQSEAFGGILPRVAARLLAHEARHGFEAMNRELARRAERAEFAVPPTPGPGSERRARP